MPFVKDAATCYINRSVSLKFLETQGSEGKVIFLALVRLRDSESFEQAFRRFKKQCEKAGILSEVKKREHYEKPSVRLKKKSISARKRLIKKLKKQQQD